MLARLAVNIQQITLIVKPFFLYFKSISTTNQGVFVKTNVIIGGGGVVHASVTKRYKGVGGSKNSVTYYMGGPLGSNFLTM